MPTPSLSPPSKGLFYGWWVALGCAFGYSTLCAIYWFGTMSFPQLKKEFGWTAADLGLLQGFSLVLGIIWFPLVGWICERIGSRRMVFLFAPILATALMLYPTVTKLWQMIILWPVLAGLGAAGACSIGIGILPRKWFKKRAGLVTGLMGGCWCLVSVVLFPTVSFLGVRFGWRPTLLCLVPVFLVLTLIITYFWIWDDPETKGLNPDGMSDEEMRKLLDADAGEKEESYMTCAEALRTPQFWLSTVAFALTCNEVGVIQSQITLMATRYGISLEMAGTAMSALMIAALVGRVGIGPIGDRFGRRKTILAIGIISAWIMFAGWKFVDNPTSLYLFLGGLGLVMMGGFTLFPPLGGDLFGRKHLAGIGGFSGAVSGLIAGGATYLAGYICTATGSYNWVFFMMGCLFIVQVVLMCLLRPTRVQLALKTAF